MKVQFGDRELEMGGKYLTELRDSNDLLGDPAALRARLEQDGYLLIRGFHDRERVQAARMELLQKLDEQGALDPGAPLMDGVIGPKGGYFRNVNEEDYPNFYQVVNHASVFRFFDELLGGPSMTFDHKWVRAIGRGDNTGAHYDIVYMGRGTKQVYTTWTPFGDLPIEMGTLAMLLGSHQLDPIKRTYGAMDVDRDAIDTGWFTTDPVEMVDRYGGQWATTDFRMGDAMIFGMFMMHGSTNNTTNRYRISADTRYQLASEPADERWNGPRRSGHRARANEPAVPMREAREQWGV